MVKRWDKYVTPENMQKGVYYDTVPVSAVKGFRISEAYTNRPADNSNLPSSQVSDFYVPYVVPSFGSFIQCYEYYRTIGKVQNVVDAITGSIINREWYFESDKPSRIKIMEDWEEKFDLSRIFESVTRDWLVFGNSILGYSDWQPMQMSTILGSKRDIYGKPEYFVQTVNGKVVDIDAAPFLFSKFIEMNRDAWGLPLFGGLMASNYVDIDGKQPIPFLQVYRQIIQDLGRIVHRFASPRIIYGWAGVNPNVLEKDIKPILESMRPGDRAAFNYLPTMVSEQVDLRNRVDNMIDWINKEIEVGLQSSKSRLITNPSAMADARVAAAQDDEMVLAIMEKLRRLMNKYIIPRIVGEANVCFFKWGAKDTLELEFPEGLMSAVTPAMSDGKRVISIPEARMILSIKGWKLDDSLYQQDMNQQVYPMDWLGDPNIQDPSTAKNFVDGMKNHIQALTGKAPTPQDYNPSSADLDTNISGQGDMPPYRDHTYWPAGTYPNKRPPNATGRGMTAGNPFTGYQTDFGGSQGEAKMRETLQPEFREYAYLVKGKLVFRGGGRKL